MDTTRLARLSEHRWRLPPEASRAAVEFFASRPLLLDMEDEVLRQICGVASLPGLAGAALVLPDAHSGYGFPIGGVAAFDAHEGGVVSAGGVGFDIACGVRTLATNLDREDVLAAQEALAQALFQAVPSGLGRDGALRLSLEEVDELLRQGASWAVGRGLGQPRDLARCEERGRMAGADPARVSRQAKERLRDQVGTLGSGNHYLEVQCLAEVLDPGLADGFGLRRGQILVSIHCGSRGLGHQIGNDFLPRVAAQAARHGLRLPDKELACAPIRSDLGQEYLAAMACGVNCALANRQVIGHLARQALERVFPGVSAEVFYDVCHNTCRVEEHVVEGRARRLHVHRKGATRAFPPGHPDLPPDLAPFGQPVLVGGSMGGSSYILAGVAGNPALASACHGAGRIMSRTQARKRFRGRDVLESLRLAGIRVCSADLKGVAEEAPGAYKDETVVVASAAAAGLARPVARLEPLVCIKG